MRIAILTCCVLALALLALIGLSYMPGMSLKVAVSDVENGVVVQNAGDTLALCLSVCLKVYGSFN
jgi:hypothetical protein